MGECILKKVVIGIVLLALPFLLIITYNHLQQPTKNDVFTITEKWSPSTEEVYLIREIDGKLLTIFSNVDSIFIAELKQNWLGTWTFRDNAILASSYYSDDERDKIIWGAAENRTDKIVNYYFGMVIDPEIDNIKIETGDDFFEDIKMIKTEGNRFYFKEVYEPVVMPVNITGFSKTGEIIYSSLKQISTDKE